MVWCMVHTYVVWHSMWYGTGIVRVLTVTWLLRYPLEYNSTEWTDVVMPFVLDFPFSSENNSLTCSITDDHATIR